MGFPQTKQYPEIKTFQFTCFMSCVGTTSEESIGDFLDAVEQNWQPKHEGLGAAAKEVLGCMPWSAKQASLQMVESVGEHLDAQLNL